MNPQVKDFPSDIVSDKKSSGKHKTGKGSRQARTDAFRLQKNQKTADDILTGVFARLKISDPTNVSSAPLAKEVHPVAAPIGIKTLPSYSDRVWDAMEAIGTRPFAQLNNHGNKDIFKKGTLILAEAKLSYAQRNTPATPDDELPAKKLYTEEELRDLNQMANSIPLPLAVFLECIGTTKDADQIITPIAAISREQPALSGALTWFPRQLLPLLRMFRDGVAIDGVVHALADHLQGLPGFALEEFIGPGLPPGSPPNMVRLTHHSAAFWLDGDAIRWTDHDYRIFEQIVRSLDSKRGFNVTLDLSHGAGTSSQLVQTVDWRVDQSTQWFTMTPVDDYSIKLGATFALAINQDVAEQSRFSGSLQNAYARGELTPRRIVSALLSNLER